MGYCNQCAKSLGKPLGDFANLGNTFLDSEGKFCPVKCEGCGETKVDCLGNCKTYCTQQHYVTALLEDWHVETVPIPWSDSAYLLFGKVFNDQSGRFVDGTPIHTSAVRIGELVLAALPGDVIETNGSFYLLGKPA